MELIMLEDEDDSYEDDGTDFKDIVCDQCSGPINLLKTDEFYEKYITPLPHGRFCPRCLRFYCNDCGEWGKNKYGDIICINCYTECLKNIRAPY
jgi:hypothetical protein